MVSDGWATELGHNSASTEPRGDLGFSPYVNNRVYLGKVVAEFRRRFVNKPVRVGADMQPLPEEIRKMRAFVDSCGITGFRFVWEHGGLTLVPDMGDECEP